MNTDASSHPGANCRYEQPTALLAELLAKASILPIEHIECRTDKLPVSLLRGMDSLYILNFTTCRQVRVGVVVELSLVVPISIRLAKNDGSLLSRSCYCLNNPVCIRGFCSSSHLHWPIGTERMVMSTLTVFHWYEPKVDLPRGKMYDNQKLAYINAIKCLQTKPSKTQHLYPGARSRFDDYVATHINMTDMHYFTARILFNALLLLPAQLIV